MNRSRKWFWFLLFVSAALLIGGLATGWNVVLVRDYEKMVGLARGVVDSQSIASKGTPWKALILGTAGFAAALGIIVLFFFKLLREMRLNQMQSEFLATVTHELKTPIATVELSTNLLRKGDLSSEESNQLWDSIDSELKRLRSEVEELLEAARWQSGSVTINRTAIALESWLEESMRRWRTILGPGSRIRREGDPLNAIAMIDPRSMSLITDNILDNARKFARGTPSVVVRTRRIQGKKWQIEFSDEGWGFDPSESPQLFTKFFRAKTDAPYAIPGAGLGLFIAATACKATGVKLSGISDGRGRGARFTLEGKEARA